jgi:hypothetical protein
VWEVRVQDGISSLIMVQILFHFSYYSIVSCDSHLMTLTNLKIVIHAIVATFLLCTSWGLSCGGAILPEGVAKSFVATFYEDPQLMPCNASLECSSIS